MMGTRHELITVCRLCSMLDPSTTPHGEDGCTSDDWIEVERAVKVGASANAKMPHPDGGWPEVELAVTYMVYSDDPAVVEAVRHELLENAGL